MHDAPVERPARVGRWLAGSALLLFLAIGFIIVPDYGISWDESTSRNNGLVSLKYVLERFDSDYLADDPHLRAVTTPLAKYHDRDYGVAFEATAGILERGLALSDIRDIFQFRHLLTFLASTAGLIAVFVICRRRYGSIWAGIAAGMLLVTSPRQFAESFYNSKDILLMAFVAAAIATHLRMLSRPTVTAALIHGGFTALAMNIRVTAVGVALLTVATLVVALALVPDRRRRFLIALAVYVVATVLLTFAMWPFLWDDPWNNFVAAVGNMARFRWPGSVYFLGEVFPATALPWYYLPTWIAQTTPPHVLVAFVLGLGTIFARLVRVGSGPRIELSNLAQDIVLLLYFLGPVVGVIVLDSVVYDGWRQVYFAYPAMLCIACGGLVWAWRALAEAPTARLAIAALFGASILHTVAWMVRAHPHQYVYFNSLARTPWIEHYDTDYWGVTGVEALKIALADASSDPVKVWAASAMHLALSTQMLHAEDRARVRLVTSKDEADYVVTTYREHWSRPHDVLEGLTVLAHIRVEDQIICSVFRSNRERPQSPETSTPFRVTDAR